MTKEMMHKSNQCQSFKKEWEVKQDEIYDPENDYFNVKKNKNRQKDQNIIINQHTIEKIHIK